MNDNIIQIRTAWAGRRHCCFCFNVCFVHSCSDGHFRCGTCAEKLIIEKNGEWADNFPSVSLNHVHEWGIRQEVKEKVRDGDLSFITQFIDPCV
jgi:hypothetical protein